MRRVLTLVALVACAHPAPPPTAASASAPQASAPPAATPAVAPAPRAPPPWLATLPPLIERETFFGDPEISGGELSPDGKYIAFRKPYKGTMNVWVKRRTEPFSAAR